jgi:hypothetical protein
MDDIDIVEEVQESTTEKRKCMHKSIVRIAQFMMVENGREAVD